MITIPDLENILFFEKVNAQEGDYIFDLPAEVKFESFKILMNYRFITVDGHEMDSSTFRTQTPLSPDIIGFRKSKFDRLVLSAPFCILSEPHRDAIYCFHTSDYFGVIERLMYDSFNHEGHVNKALVRLEWEDRSVKKLEIMDMNHAHVVNGAYSSLPLLTFLASGLPGAPTLTHPLHINVTDLEQDDLSKALNSLVKPHWITRQKRRYVYSLSKAKIDPSGDPMGDDEPDLSHSEIDTHDKFKSIILLICLIILAQIIRN